MKINEKKLELLSSGEHLRRYRPNLRRLPLVKTVNAAILMTRLEELFLYHPDGFRASVRASEYQATLGNISWEEELGFTEKQFVHAWNQIGVRHTRKTEFSPELFEGKYYTAVRHPASLNEYMYFRNHALIRDHFANN